MTEVTAGRTNWGRLAAIPLAAAAFVVLLMLVGPTSSGARSKPTCFGKTANQVGTNGNDKIVAKPNAVVYAGKGNDTVTVVDHDHTTHILCGGPGNDDIEGGPEKDTVIGGEGADKELAGGRGNDLVVGDNANPQGDESGPTSNDVRIEGGLGDDFLVGDNYANATGDATGATGDAKVLGNEGKDIVIGDDAALGTGNATGGANDHLEGADGDDLVIGDSYANHGTATGGGNDQNNSGPGKDLAVGDSYTVDGHASGNGNDDMHAADGGDFDATCQPASSCDDVFWGDSYAKVCLAKSLICPNVSGGGNDLLTTDQGTDFMNGGESSHATTGNNRDKCAGGTGIDTAGNCDYYYDDVEVHLP